LAALWRGQKPLVVVANVFIPAVLGAKLRHLDLDNAEKVRFFGPEVCLADSKSTSRTEIRVVSSKTDADPFQPIQLRQGIEPCCQVPDFSSFSPIRYATSLDRAHQASAH
jgi:hypothetical protein